MTYRYTESGLDNVVLKNGYHIEHHPAYGELVTIENVGGLHMVISQNIVNLGRPLNGAEFRFLRIELDLSQKALSAILGVTDQAVAKWEKAAKKSVANKAAERLLRILYIEKMNQDSEIHKMLSRLSDLDSKIGERDFLMSKSADGWAQAA